MMVKTFKNLLQNHLTDCLDTWYLAFGVGDGGLVLNACTMGWATSSHNNSYSPSPTTSNTARHDNRQVSSSLNDNIIGNNKLP